MGWIRRRWPLLGPRNYRTVVGILVRPPLRHSIAVAFPAGISTAFAKRLLLVTFHFTYLTRPSALHPKDILSLSHTLQVMQPVRTLSLRFDRLPSGVVNMVYLVRHENEILSTTRCDNMAATRGAMVVQMSPTNRSEQNSCLLLLHWPQKVPSPSDLFQGRVGKRNRPPVSIAHTVLFL